MIMAFIAPELIVTWAMRQWLSTYYITRKFEESGYPNVRPEQLFRADGWFHALRGWATLRYTTT
jgi:hypothetical protein